MKYLIILILMLMLMLMLTTTAAAAEDKDKATKSDEAKLAETYKAVDATVHSYNVRAGVQHSWLVAELLVVTTAKKYRGVELPAKRELITVHYNSVAGRMYLDVKDHYIMFDDIKEARKQFDGFLKMAEALKNSTKSQTASMYQPTLTYKYLLDGKLVAHKGMASIGLAHSKAGTDMIITVLDSNNKCHVTVRITQFAVARIRKKIDASMNDFYKKERILVIKEHKAAANKKEEKKQ